MLFFSSRRRHTRCALVTGVQTCDLPISVPTNYYAPEYRYITDRDQYRRRWGASLGVNFRPTDELEVSAQYFHSDLKIDTREASVKFPFGQGESQGLVGSYNINENGVLTDGTVRAHPDEVISFVDVSKIKADNPHVQSEKRPVRKEWVRTCKY